MLRIVYNITIAPLAESALVRVCVLYTNIAACVLKAWYGDHMSEVMSK